MFSQQTCIDVGVEHFWDKPHSGRFVWVLLCELNCQLKRPILLNVLNKNNLYATLYYLKGGIMWSKDNSIPKHDVVVTGGATYTL